MRVALIQFCKNPSDKQRSLIKILEQGAAAKGNQVDLLNGYEVLEGTRLTMYDYIAIVLPAAGFFGAIPDKIGEYLSTSGMVSGKKGCALVLKGGFGSQKTITRLMKAMEREGIKLDYFEIIRSADHAVAVAANIG